MNGVGLESTTKRPNNVKARWSNGWVERRAIPQYASPSRYIQETENQIIQDRSSFNKVDSDVT